MQVFVLDVLARIQHIENQDKHVIVILSHGIMEVHASVINTVYYFKYESDIYVNIFFYK
jgi:hypothetical protein